MSEDILKRVYAEHAAKKAARQSDSKTPVSDFTTLDFELLLDSGINSRTTMDPARLDGLAKSIRRRGVRMPLEVIELPPDETGQTRYEVSSGNRRIRAIRRVCADLLAEGETDLLARRRAVPVRILTEDEARERKYLELIENLQREDISPLDEAEAYRWLVENHHDTPASIADELGMTRQHIHNRLRLPDAPRVLLDAMRAGQVGAAQCEMVGGIPIEAERERAAHLILHPQGKWAWKTEPLNRDETREMIRDLFMVSLLAKAKPGFDLEDATLAPEAGPCGPCPHRAENAEDVRVAAYGTKQRGVDPMTCLNPPCARAKRAETLRRMAAATKSEVLSEEAAAAVFAGLGGGVAHDSDYVPMDSMKAEVAQGWTGPTYLARNPKSGETVLLVEKSAAADLERATKGRKSLDASVSETIWDRDGNFLESAGLLLFADLSPEQQRAWDGDVYVARNLKTGETHDLVSKTDLARWLKKRKGQSTPKPTGKPAVEAMERLMQAIFSQGLTEADVDALTATELQETPAALEMFRLWLKPKAKEDAEAIAEMMEMIGSKGAGASTAYLAIAILSYGLRERGTEDPAYQAFAERFGVE